MHQRIIWVSMTIASPFQIVTIIKSVSTWTSRIMVGLYYPYKQTLWTFIISLPKNSAPSYSQLPWGELNHKIKIKSPTSGRGTEEDVNYGPGQKRDISLRPFKWTSMCLHRQVHDWALQYYHKIKIREGTYRYGCLSERQLKM